MKRKDLVVSRNSRNAGKGRVGGVFPEVVDTEDGQQRDKREQKEAVWEGKKEEGNGIWICLMQDSAKTEKEKKNHTLE